MTARHAKRLFSYALIAGGFAGAFLLSHGIARADCGATALKTFAGQAKQIEAMPLTLININQWSRDNAPPPHTLAITKLDPVMQCPEDSLDLWAAQDAIASKWKSALGLQADYALLQFQKKGERPNAPAACAPVQAAILKHNVINSWGGPIWYNAKRKDLFLKNQYFTHVHSLFESLAVELGIALPMNGPDIDTEEQALQKAAMSARAHLPYGVNC